MEGRQHRLIGRLLGKFRGEHNKTNLERRFSLISAGTSDSTGYGSSINVAADEGCSGTTFNPQVDTVQTPSAEDSTDGSRMYGAAASDLRYSGQYLTPEQLPEFCDQLHNLVEVLRNIQSYAKITGEYPSEMERRLEQEAREVAALAAEAKNALHVVNRTRTQRRAVRDQRRQLAAHVAALKDTEVRELESTVRTADRKLFKNWETLKDSNEPSVFRSLIEEIRNKQSALECLTRLIDNRCAALERSTPVPRPLPPPPPAVDTNDGNNETISNVRKRADGSRRGGKRKRKDSGREPRSVPLSGEPSRHAGSESTSRYRVGSAGTVTITPLELPSRGSVRDIFFFTAS